MVAVLKGLARHIPSGVIEWTEPAGGCTLWAHAPGLTAAHESALVQQALGEGVAITPGSLFFPTPPEQLHFRLSIAKAKVHEVEEGCRRLGRALAAML
jgi:2-aminoadipate transaminase